MKVSKKHTFWRSLRKRTLVHKRERMSINTSPEPEEHSGQALFNSTARRSQCLSFCKTYPPGRVHHGFLGLMARGFYGFGALGWHDLRALPSDVVFAVSGMRTFWGQGFSGCTEVYRIKFAFWSNPLILQAG